MNKLGLVGLALLTVACDRPLLHEVVGRKAPTDTNCAPQGLASGLGATVSDGAIVLTWVVSAADGDGFIVERAEGLGLAWGEVGRTSTGVLSYSDTTIAIDGDYFYRVTPFKVSGSDICEATPSAVLEVLSLPAAPTDLGIDFVSVTSGTLSWTDVSVHESGYRIERADAGGSFVELGTVLANVTAYTDDTLVASTSYEYRVTAYNDAGASAAATLSTRAPGPPVLSWGAAPTIDDACVLDVPGVPDIATGVSVASASGTIAKASGTVSADAGGIAAVLTDRTAGTFATSWTVVDSIGGTDTINRDLSLAISTVYRTGSRRAALTADADTMVGRQADLAGCKDCVGRRGSVAAGLSHSCLVTDAGEVRCWGDGSYGALGNGYSDALANPAATCGGPTSDPCSAPLAASTVVAGGSHSCAIVGASNTLYCWGSNSYGQLGDGTTTSRTYPTPVCTTGSTDTADCVPLTGVASVSLGASHTCAIVAGGEAYCFGYNNYGQLGDGTSINRWNPVLVCATGSTDTADCVGLGASLGALAQVSLGNEHSCARTTAGALRCWGTNYYSELGIGDWDSNDHPNPVPACASGSVAGASCVAFTDVVSDVAAGSEHTCVVLQATGELRCWGKDSSGQLGDASSATWSWRDNPVPVCATGSGAGADCVALTGATRVACGNYHTCALVGTDVRCWGANTYGQLGDGNTTDRDNPVTVCATGSTDGGDCVALTGVDALVLGTYASCMQMTSGALKCVGRNSKSLLGLGVNFSAVNNVTQPGDVCLTGSGATCTAVSGAASLSLRDDAVCAIIGGNVRCWGDNYYDQAGIGSSAVGLPAKVCATGVGVDCVPLTGVRAVVAGDSYSCALMEDSGAKCWGLNPNGVLGNGTTDTFSNPTDVCASGAWDGSACMDGGSPSRLTGLVSLAASWEATCGVTTTGAVLCWGRDEYGALGDGTPAAYADLAANPAPVCASGFGAACTPLTGAVSVAIADTHGCALLQDGGVTCWGENDFGQVGSAVTSSYNPTPVCATGTDPTSCIRLSNVEMLALGWQHSCALIAGGEVRCWGRRNHGQLGDGYAVDDQLQYAVPVCASSAGASCPRLSGAISIASGFNHACALLADGGVRCWGEASSGALGDGTWWGSDVPTPLPRPVCAPDAAFTCDYGATCTAPLAGIVGLASYGNHVCALTDAGGAQCWGFNKYGQLGSGVVPYYNDGECVAVDVCQTGSGAACPALSGVALRTCDLATVSVP